MLEVELGQYHKEAVAHPMIVTAQGGTYIWHGAFEEREVPERAGFEWTHLGQWTTQRHGVAAGLFAHFDDKARAMSAHAAESMATAGDFAVPVPPGKVLLGYQKAGVAAALKRLRVGGGCLLADEQRLGKSVQTCGVINACPDIMSVLIACPATIKLHWKAELEAWLTTKFSIAVVWPGMAALPRASILIVNYDLLHKFVWPEVDLLVLDEAHFCKNPKARRTKKALALRAKHKLYLTGTPILSRPIEIFTLLKSLDPRSWPSWEAFGMRYCAGFVGEHGYDFTGHSNTEELHDKLRSTVMVRRLRVEVWKDLPPVRREVVELPAYGKVLNREKIAWDAAATIANKYETDVEKLKAARRVAFEDTSAIRHETALAKVPQALEFILEALEAEPNDKLVIFAWHKDVIDHLARALQGHKPLVINGEVPVKDRKAIEDRFRADGACRVFLGNMVAAGTGLDLSVASHVVFAELDWTPGIVKQCEDRCQNPSKRDTILVQHLVLEGSLDAAMARMLVRKQDVSDRTLDGKENAPLDFSEIFAMVEQKP